MGLSVLGELIAFWQKAHFVSTQPQVQSLVAPLSSLFLQYPTSDRRHHARPQSWFCLHQKLSPIEFPLSDHPLITFSTAHCLPSPCPAFLSSGTCRPSLKHCPLCNHLCTSLDSAVSSTSSSLASILDVFVPLSTHIVHPTHSQLWITPCCQFACAPDQ